MGRIVTYPYIIDVLYIEVVIQCMWQPKLGSPPLVKWLSWTNSRMRRKATLRSSAGTTCWPPIRQTSRDCGWASTASTWRHGCQMAIAIFLDCICLALRAWRTMAPLRCAAKFDPFLSTAGLNNFRIWLVGVQRYQLYTVAHFTLLFLNQWNFEKSNDERSIY